MKPKLSLLFLLLAHLALGAESLAQIPAPSCPTVAVEYRIKNPLGIASWHGVCPGAMVVFTASVHGLGPGEEPGFHWTVAGGEIVGGQGTSSITVQSNETQEGAVTATVQVGEVSGFKPVCDRTGSATVGPAGCCMPPCPTLTITCPEDVPHLGEDVTIYANVSGGDPQLNLKYRWQVSAGEIIGGQGTPTIKVSTLNTAGESITATLEVEGLPPECDRTESCTLPVAEYSPPSRLFDRYGDTGEEDEKLRLDGLVFQLGREPGATGYVVVYGASDAADAKPRLERIKNYLASAGDVGAGRIVVMDGGPRARPGVELYIRPAGAAPPKSAPRF